MLKLCQMVFSTVPAAVSCLLYLFDKSSSLFEHFLTFWGNRCSKPTYLSCPDPGTSHVSLVLVMKSVLRWAYYHCGVFASRSSQQTELGNECVQIHSHLLQYYP